MFSYVCDFVVAWCIGNCEIAACFPMGIALVYAGSIYGRKMIALVLGMLLALVSRQEMVQGWVIVRYMLEAVITLGILQMRSVQVQRPRQGVMTAICGLVTAIVNLGFAIAGWGLDVWTACLETVLVVCLCVVYGWAYRALQEGKDMTDETKKSIAIWIFMASMLFGMPIHFFGEIEVLQSVCIFGICYCLYRFGVREGIAWTALCGSIYGFRVEQTDSLLAWIVLACICGFVLSWIRCGRYCFACFFVVAYLLLGYLAFPILLTETGWKAFATAVLLNLFLPGQWYYPIERISGGVEENGALWGDLVLHRIRELAKGFERMDYTLAVAGQESFALGQIGSMLCDVTQELEGKVAMKERTQALILDQLAKYGIVVRALTLIKERQGYYRLYIIAYVKRGRVVSAKKVEEILSKQTGIAFLLSQESRQIVGTAPTMLVLNQKPVFRVETAVRRLAKHVEIVSGDNFYIGKTQPATSLLMLADGMGNGMQASKDSQELLDAMEELLQTGVREQLSVQLVNACLATKNRGEHFSTLDLLLIDLYTGYGQMMKYGAATSYIKRADWIESVSSTSLPMGVHEQAACACTGKKFYDGDFIVMVSDGVLESLMCENKDDYMREILLGCEEGDAQSLVDHIIESVHAVCGNRLKDDATVLVCKIMKNL
ncbi:MAG: SpoIIE family protein phosphatase [Wujia sp.]